MFAFIFEYIVKYFRYHNIPPPLKSQYICGCCVGLTLANISYQTNSQIMYKSKFPIIAKKYELDLSSPFLLVSYSVITSETITQWTIPDTINTCLLRNKSYVYYHSMSKIGQNKTKNSENCNWKGENNQCLTILYLPNW